MKEAMAQMRTELGEDAVILSTRTMASQGASGTAVELVAALDSEIPGAATAPLRPIISSLKTQAEASADENTEKPLKTPESHASPLLQQAAFSQLQNELLSLREMLSDVSDNVRYRYSAALGPMYSRIFKKLRAEDISEETALQIVGELSSKGPHQDITEAITQARHILLNHISIAEPLQNNGKRKVVLCVGTTGSGKTTTIAKLAVLMKLVFKTNVLIISADSYKVGGAEQLQTFAAIAGIPFQVAYSTQELRQILRQETQRDFIFIDTTGRSQQNKAQMNDLTATAEAATPDITYLIQSATTSEATIKQVLKSFKSIQPDALILTKLDEAASLGGIIDALEENKLPLAYLCNGQQIPDDIEPASREKLAEKILPYSLALE
jgi:flagellar biosynthesis protein FlhF